MSVPAMPRRRFLEGAAAAAGTLVLGGLARPTVREAGAAPAPRAARPAAPARADAGRLGVASYSLREFPRDRAIAMLRTLGARAVNVKSVHLAYDLPPAQIAAARAEFEAAGIAIVGGGTVTFEHDTDADVGRYFEYARAAGMPLLVATADPRLLPRIARHAERAGVAVAIHNHGPEDRHYPSPYDALRHVRAMHPGMGLCVDVGHTARAGDDIVRAIADAGPRVLDLHLKDLADPREAASQVAVGEGRLPIAAILRQLAAMRFRGAANLEYEIEPADPLPGMRRSFAYLRGALAGIMATEA